MEIDRIEFIAWMERIMDRFDLLKEQIDKAEKRKNSLDGKLPYYTISGKIYYKLSDVHQFIREHFSVPVTALKAKNGNTMPKKDNLS